MGSRTSRLAALLALLASLLITLGAPASAQDDPSLATPEDAVREYLAGVAEADAERILGASAIDEAAEGYDFVANTEALRAFLPFQSLGPSEYPLSVEANRAQLTSRVLSWVQMLAYGLLTGEEIEATGIVPADRAWAEAFVGQVDPARLAGLEVMDIRFPDADLQADERYLELSAAQAARYGADELTERLALISFEDQLYELGFTLLRYGDDWKVFSQISALGGTSPLGTASPTTAEDFEIRTSGE
jgi:hypothetical protein